MERGTEMTTLKRERIHVDETVYPRYREDRSVINHYAESMGAGAEFPAIEIDQTGSVIDGVHRLRAYDMLGVTAIPVVRKTVKSQAEFFALALEANAHHGKQFTQIDYANMVMKGRELGLSSDLIAKIVHVTPGFLNTVTKDWFAKSPSGAAIPLKRTLAHMGGKTLTEEQVLANKKAGGWPAGFYVTQVRNLIENDLINTEDNKVMTNLEQLQESLRLFFMGRAKAMRARSNGK